MRNLHIPVPEELYVRLKDESRRSGRPATEIARNAIGAWISAVRKAAVRRDLAAYVAEMAGTDQDIDPLMQAASLLTELRGRGTSPTASGDSTMRPPS